MLGVCVWDDLGHSLCHIRGLQYLYKIVRYKRCLSGLGQWPSAIGLGPLDQAHWATMTGEPGQHHRGWTARPRPPGQGHQASVGCGAAHSLQDLKMIMRFRTEMVLNHHVADHVAKDHYICDFHLLGTFPNGGVQQKSTHRHNHTSQEIKKNMQIFYQFLEGLS